MNSSGFTLTLLDVLTCGMGGMLLLFVIIIAVNDDLTFDKQQAASQAGREDGDRVPLAVILTGSARDPLWPAGGESPWVVPVKLQEEELVRFSHGKNYAVLFAKNSSETGPEIWVGPLPPGASASVCVAFGNRKIHLQTADQLAALPRRADGKVRIWPLPQEGTTP